MKKVGILVNSIGYGGNERSAVNIAKAISGKYDVSIIIQEDKGNHYGYPGKVISLNTPCAVSKAGKAVNAIRRIVRLKRVIRQDGIETLFTILPVTNPINYMRFRCKTIVSCRDCGDLIRRTDHYIRMTEKADLMICNSEYQAEYLKGKVPSLADRIRAIPNIVDTEKVNQLKGAEPDPGIASFMAGGRCIVSLGRFAPAKGLNNLIKAFSLLAREDETLRMVMMGDGELREEVEKLIAGLGLGERILLTGFQDNPFRYIARADAFVLPSFYEGFPNVLVEAMACGVPVIAADCPSGPAEILSTVAEGGRSIGKGGILVRGFDEARSSWDPADIGEDHRNLADAVRMVLGDSALHARLAAEARERTEDFSSRKITAAWEAVL